MLVLSRKLGESVVIQLGDQSVEVMVTSIKSMGAVRLGFIAPVGIEIYRKELLGRSEPEPSESDE